MKLSEAINKLYIFHLQSLAKPLIVKDQELNRREWVTPIVNDLSQILRERTRDFDIFAGFNIYKKLIEYIEMLVELSQETRPIKLLHSLINNTIRSLKKALEAQAPLFQNLQLLLPLFHEVREILGRTPVPKSQMKKAAMRWERQLHELYQSLTGYSVPRKLKWQRITANTPLHKIVAEWIRLYSTHKRGLFYFLKVANLPRSNVALEKMYSLEVHHFRMASGRAQVGNMVRVKGGELCIVQQNYSPNLIDKVLLQHDRERVKAGIAQFRERHRLQSTAWHTKQSNVPRIRQLIKETNELLTNP